MELPSAEMELPSANRRAHAHSEGPVTFRFPGEVYEHMVDNRLETDAKKVRNRIYRYCIVAPGVREGSDPDDSAQPNQQLRIVSATTEPIRSFGDTINLGKPTDGASFHEYWTDNDHRTVYRNFGRSSWRVNPMEYFRKFVLNRSMGTGPIPTITSGGFNTFEASYHIDVGAPSLDINLFLVCKPVCQEASTMFFADNHFVFAFRWEDVCLGPMAFLNDHPGAYHWMRSLHIDIPDLPDFAFNEWSSSFDSTLPSNGNWNKLIDQIRKMKLRHLGLTVPVDVHDRQSRSSPDFPISVPVPCHWLERMKLIGGLESMQLMFGISKQYWNHDIATVNDGVPSDIPAILVWAERLQACWLSGKGTVDNTEVFLVYNRRITRVDHRYRVNRLEFVSRIDGSIANKMPPLSWKADNSNWRLHEPLTERYRAGEYSPEGLARVSHDWNADRFRRYLSIGPLQGGPFLPRLRSG